MLHWRLIFEQYGHNIEYISGEKLIAADALSRLPNNRNQETTHESMYLTEKMLEIYYIEEIPAGMFPLYFKIIDRYQQEDHIIMVTSTCTE